PCTAHLPPPPPPPRTPPAFTSPPPGGANSPPSYLIDWMPVPPTEMEVAAGTACGTRRSRMETSPITWIELNGQVRDLPFRNNLSICGGVNAMICCIRHTTPQGRCRFSILPAVSESGFKLVPQPAFDSIRPADVPSIMDCS